MFKASPHVTESFLKLAAGETPLELETNKSLDYCMVTTAQVQEKILKWSIFQILYVQCALMADFRL